MSSKDGFGCKACVSPRRNSRVSNVRPGFADIPGLTPAPQPGVVVAFGVAFKLTPARPPEYSFFNFPVPK